MRALHSKAERNKVKLYSFPLQKSWNGRWVKITWRLLAVLVLSIINTKLNQNNFTKKKATIRPFSCTNTNVTPVPESQKSILPNDNHHSWLRNGRRPTRAWPSSLRELPRWLLMVEVVGFDDASMPVWMVGRRTRCLLVVIREDIVQMSWWVGTVNWNVKNVAFC